MKKYRHLVVGAVIALVTVAGVNAGTVSQEVVRNDSLPIGTLVSINPDNSDEMILSDTNNGQYLFGVVTREGQSLAELGTDSEGTLIATNGDVSTIVSTVKGDIIKGDVISVSEVTGLAAKVTLDGGTTLGIALEDFNASSENARTVTTTNDNGEKNEILIGSIAVRLAINDFYVDQFADSNVLQSTGERLVGRPVSLWQVITAGAIAFASILIGGYTIYAAVHGSFISVGRNPLSSQAVFSGLFFVTLISIVVILVGMIAAYLVLLI